ncbi:MAG: ArsR family transcriptional regulator [Sulfuritalea sp.]|jgi:rhodanese-related sulfurtransferase/DNA-binding transcriptional regulator YhcF (GntR family)|nr:metalloregulator ArsR/SmtB family transcription factor [Sulfuritalea sp.]MBP6637554.1 ArsR family transcriptional regulator [Sulfuritalea sp.]MBP7423757.1 ArsR family transcriptional regulator [Sulfuritalea sp.]
MSTGNFKQDVYLQLARVAKAVGHANRLELLEFVAQGPRSVDELAGMTKLSVANASKHLQELRQAGLVKARKEGVRVFYEVAGPDVVDLLGALRVVAESRVAEVSQLLRTYITARDDLEPVPARELMQRAKQGLVTVLDVRPAEEYAAGHVPGAINVTLDALSSHLRRLPKGREVIAYCRGPYCLLSVDAVAMLRDKGYQARRMEDGFPEWKAAGMPVEETSLD